MTRKLIILSCNTFKDDTNHAEALEERPAEGNVHNHIVLQGFGKEAAEEVEHLNSLVAVATVLDEGRGEEAS